MRSRFDEQLNLLNRRMIEMGSECERIIEASSVALLKGDVEEARKIKKQGHIIDQLEKEIESMCLKLLLQQQPVANDLRFISAALKMITDMERIGDQAEDICEIIIYLNGRKDIEYHDIKKMSEATIKMVRQSIDAFVKKDMDLAQAVIEYDDVVDDLFVKIRKKLIDQVTLHEADGSYVIDLLMIAKYYERIGDHATNIAEWVKFAVTGVHKGE